MAELFDKVLRFVGSDRSARVLCGEFNIAPAAAAKIAVGLATPAILANIERLTYAAEGRDWIDGLASVGVVNASDFQQLTLRSDYQDYGEGGAALILGRRHDRVVRMVSERSETTQYGAEGVLSATTWVVASHLAEMLREGTGIDEVIETVRSENAELAATGWGPWLQATADARDVGTLAVPTPAGAVSASNSRSYPPPLTGEARDEATGLESAAPTLETTVGDGPSNGGVAIGNGTALGNGAPLAPRSAAGIDVSSAPTRRRGALGDRSGEPAWDRPSTGVPQSSGPPRRLLLIVALALVLGLLAGAVYRQFGGSSGDGESNEVIDSGSTDSDSTGNGSTDGASGGDSLEDGASAAGPNPISIATLELDLGDPLDRTPATGTAMLTFDRIAEEVCYEFDVDDLQTPFKGHIHVGPAGVKGGIVVDFGVLSETPVGCVPTNVLDIDLILSDPVGHYVELHDGNDELTIRNQLHEARGDIEALTISPGPTDADVGGAYVALESGRVVLRGEAPDVETEEKLLATFADIGLQETDVVSELTIVPGAPRPSGRIVVTESIVFELNSSTLSDEDDEIFTDLAAILGSRPAWSMEIVGHTDTTGNDLLNLELSLSRAEAVRDVLVERGVSPDVLAVRGAGSTEPIADNSSGEGRAQNRRIEFRIVGG